MIVAVVVIVVVVVVFAAFVEVVIQLDVAKWISSITKKSEG